MKKSYTAISLFTGAGGMDIGFEKAGVKILLANELMSEAVQTYKSNRIDANIIHDDVNNIFKHIEEFKGVDFVFGGPPCQGFSVAGKMDPNDERNKLIFTFLDVVEYVQPKVFVMENVKALAKLERWSEVRKKYFEKVEQMGYNCTSFVLNATEFGVPQKRERAFFIGIKNNTDIFLKHNLLEILNQHKTQAPSVRETLQDLGKAGTEKNPNTCTSKITFATNPIMRKSPYSGMYFNGQGRPINVDEYANTLPASMGGNKTPFIDEEYLYGNAESDWVVGYHSELVEGKKVPEFKEAPSRLRRLSIREASRIQTFPDDYIFSGSKGKIYTQIGNAVPCNLAEAIASSIIQYISEQ